MLRTISPKRVLRVIFFALGVGIGAQKAFAQAPSMLGVKCGATPEELRADGGTLVDPSSEMRDRLGLDLDPIFSVGGVGPKEIKSKLATRLPEMPEQFGGAELLFRNDRLIKLLIALKAVDDNKNASRALEVMNKLNTELLSKYGLIYKTETQNLGPNGLIRRDVRVYQSSAGTIKIGYVWKQTEPFQATSVMVRIDFSDNCSSR